MTIHYIIEFVRTYLPVLFCFCSCLPTTTMMVTVHATTTINTAVSTPPTIAPVLSLGREDLKILATHRREVTPLPALVLADTMM